MLSSTFDQSPPGRGRDRCRDQPGIHHLNQVVVSQVLIRRFDHHRRLARLSERLVHLLQLPVVNSKRVDIDIFPPRPSSVETALYSGPVRMMWVTSLLTGVENATRCSRAGVMSTT